jgi:hypothetical protein
MAHAKKISIYIFLSVKTFPQGVTERCRLSWLTKSALVYMSPNAGKGGARCLTLSANEYRGRILGRNPDKSLKSFPPCYSQSPLQLCLEISISSNSRPYLLPYGLKKSHTETSSLKTLKIMPRNLNEVCVHEFGFSCAHGAEINLSNFIFNVCLSRKGACKLCRAENSGILFCINYLGLTFLT